MLTLSNKSTEFLFYAKEKLLEIFTFFVSQEVLFMVVVFFRHAPNYWIYALLRIFFALRTT